MHKLVGIEIASSEIVCRGGGSFGVIYLLITIYYYSFIYNI